MATTRDDANDALVPIFDMMTSFTHSLASSDWNQLIEEYNIEDIDQFTEDEFLNDWREWMWWGLAICLCLGVLMALCLPTFGCFFCCCRCCCGCCQPQKKVKKGEKDPPTSCKTSTCSFFMLLLTAGMAAACGIAIASVPVMKQELDTSDGILNDWTVSLNELDQYLNDSLGDIYNATFPPLHETADEVFEMLDTLPTEVVDRLAVESGVDPHLYALNNYTRQMENLSFYLSTMDEMVDQLVTGSDDLETALETNRVDIVAVLPENCSASDIPTECQGLRDNLNLLTPYAIYSNLSNVTDAAFAVNLAITAGIPGDVEAFVTDFQSISAEIEAETNDLVNETKEAFDDAIATAENEYDELSNELRDVIDFNEIHKELDDVKKTVDDNEEEINYAFGALLGVLLLALLSAVLMLLGTCCGCVCGSSGAKHGANCILSGISFIFIFSFLFSLLTVLFLAVGGGVELGVCRHLSTYDESAQAMEELLRTDDYNLTVRQMLDSCENNEALYTAFRLDENGYNITEFLDLDNTDLKEELDKLSNVTFEIDDVEIINDQVNATIVAIDAATSAIDFGGYEQTFMTPITYYDITTYINDLLAAADATSEPLKTALVGEAEKLNQTQVTYERPMINDRATLEEDTIGAQTIIDSIDLTATINELGEAQQFLNNELDTTVSQIMTEYTDEIYNILDQFTQDLTVSIEEDIAQCRPVYESVAMLVQGPCEYLLNPINVFAFSFAWYMSFGLIAVIIATSVVGIFRSKAVALAVFPGSEPMFNGYDLDTLKGGGIQSEINVAYDEYEDAPDDRTVDDSVAGDQAVDDDIGAKSDEDDQVEDTQADVSETRAGSSADGEDEADDSATSPTERQEY